VMTLYDVTEQKRTAALLRRQAQIIDQIPDAVISTDLAGSVTSWNQGAARMFGYPADEILGKPIASIYSSQECLPPAAELVVTLRDKGEQGVETRARRKSGEDFPSHLSLSLLCDETGNPAGMTSYIVDLTRQRREEQERRQVDQLKEELIATASHDLKSPLTSIRGFAQLLGRHIESAAPDYREIAKGLAVIDRQAAAMTQLIDDMLDASRIQAGALSLRAAPSDIRGCLATVLARLGPLERGRINVSLKDGRLIGLWDKRRIDQVLANMLGNALKYSAESERVDIVAERRDGEIEVAVCDRGMGIPPEEVPRLFERFYRTPQAHASGLPGTGLGLYICRGIIASHGGRIWVESAGPGQGTTFRFTLPSQLPTITDSETPQASLRED
jgi:PAS domain S-box-containing protein